MFDNMNFNYPYNYENGVMGYNNNIENNNYNYINNHDSFNQNSNASRLNLFEINNFYKPYIINDNMNSVINFILDYFNFIVDENGFVCVDVSKDEDIELYSRVKINGKLLNINSNIKSKNVMYFNPIVNLGVTRFIFDLFLNNNDIDILTFYITNNVLYLKDYNGNIIYNSAYFNYNLNLCYLDIIFRLCCIDADLGRWDIDNYVENLIQ